MNHDAMNDAMFWVGALFVFTPIMLTGIVVTVLWLARRRSAGRPVREHDRQPTARPPTAGT